MRARLVIAVIVTQLGATTAHALDGHRRVTQYQQTHYAARDGMPHGLANSIAQTPEGYLWTGSEEGLARFDGVSFSTYDHRKTEGIPANAFTSLAVDATGTLWAGSREHGLLHLVDGEFHPVVWAQGAQDFQVRALAFDHHGDLWVGLRDRGVVQLRAGALVATFAARDGLPSDDIRSLFVAHDGALWIGTFRGLVRWSAGKLAHGPVALDGVAINGLSQAPDGDLWCATANGLAHVRGDSVEWVGAERLPGDLGQVLFDRDGNLWIGTTTGAARMTPDARIEQLANPAAVVLALFEDSEGDVWIASEKGLDRLRDGDVVPFGAGEGLTDEAVFGIREDPSGALWIASADGLLRRAPERAAATRITEHGTMYSIFADARGDVWFGARDGGVGRWHDDHFEWLGRRDWERVRAIVEDQGSLWLGTNHGLFRLRGDRLDDAVPVLAGPIVSAILPDTTGGLWLGTEGQGLLHWRSDAPVRSEEGGPPASSSVTTLQVDPDGTLWAGTEGSGLWRKQHEHWSVFTAKDGMFDDVVWRILDDGIGYLWMSSNRGIWRVSRLQLEAKAAGQRPDVESLLFGEADGMRDRECNGNIDPAGWRTRDGRLWFPTGKGVVAIDPARLHASAAPPAVLESIRVDGQPQRFGSALAPGSSRLELGFTAPALRSPERLRFRYRLEGFDHRWNDAGVQRVAHYTNLAPGDYRFLVEAGIDGTWGRAGTVAITLLPRFYQTRWFLVLVIAGTALLIVAIPLLRLRRLRAHARELDRRVQEAIGELKVLSGMLPICAWCKKIRDDGGYWSKIEAYLSARTDAKFTHGICPECSEKMLAEDTGVEPKPPAAAS